MFVNIKSPSGDYSSPPFDLWNSKLDNHEIGYENDMIQVWHSVSVGGCFLISKKAFEKIGGYNPNFLGWGSDDTSIFNRSSIQNVVSRVANETAICWHLNHVRNDQNPYIITNAQLK